MGRAILCTLMSRQCAAARAGVALTHGFSVLVTGFIRKFKIVFLPVFTSAMVVMPGKICKSLCLAGKLPPLSADRFYKKRLRLAVFLFKRVGTDIDNIAQQIAVNRVIKSINLDGRLLIEMNKTDIEGDNLAQ